MTTTGNLAIAQDWELDAGIGGIFDGERMIIERITDQVSGFKTIDSSSRIASSKSFTDLLPAAFVEPDEGSADSPDAYGEIHVAQSWAVLIVVPHYQNNDSAAALAGPLALATIRALHGWQPSDDWDVALFQGHMAPITNVGWAMFELKFTLGVRFTT